MAKIPFDIKFRPQIESGKYKVVDNDNHNIRIICWDMKSEKKYGYCIVGLVEFGPNHEESTYYTIDGKARLMDKHPCLFIVTPEEEMTEFEKACMKLYNEGRDDGLSGDKLSNESVKESAAELLTLAREELFANDTVLKEYAQVSRKQGKAEALRTHATELTENLDKSGLDKDSIPYHLIEFMCNLYDCQNWKEIEGTAELYVTRLKAAAMKDLPRWEPNQVSYSEEPILCNGNTILNLGWVHIHIDQLKKLPGFKEDEK